MIRPRAWRFRSQIVGVVVASVALTVFIGYGGLTAFGLTYQAWLVSRMSPEAQRAIGRLEAHAIPDPQDLEALMAETAASQEEADLAFNIALGVFTLLASAVGATTGAALAARFARPVEDVAGAARAVAAGALATRVDKGRRGAGETNQLINDFNAMANALEQAERELRESSAAIAHELRTPLTVLRGRLQGIADGVFPAGSKEIASLIRHVDGLTAIVEELRVLSLASVQALVLNLDSIDLAQEIEVVLTTLAPDIAKRGVILERALAPTPLTADPARVRQIAVALIENALRYAADGKSLRIEALGDGREAILRVLDRGPGFAPDDLPRAFDRFWRADSSRSRTDGGSGLGLAIVRALARAHGGDCMAGNRDGGGASIEVRLPAGQAIQGQ